MKSLALTLCLCVVAVFTTGCGDEKPTKKGSVAGSGGSGGEGNNPSKPTAYTANAVLKPVHTNENPENISDNTVSLVGSGAGSTYKVNYTFKSAFHTSFQVLQSMGGSCLTAQSYQLISSDNQIAEMSNMTTRMTLKTNTDYTLAITFLNKSCSEFKEKLSIIAWLGSKTVNPEIGMICISKSGDPVFVSSGNSPYIFTYETKETLLNDSDYCGEHVTTGTNRGCGATFTTANTFGSPIMPTRIECTQKSPKRSGQLNVDLATHSVTLKCTDENNQETYNEHFSTCTYAVIAQR